MKNKFLIFLLSFLTFSVISCDDNDDDKSINTKSNPFEGKWNIEQVGEIQVINNENVVVYENYPTSGTCENDYYNFNTDLTYSFTKVLNVNEICTSNEVETGTYEIGADTITLFYSVTVNNVTTNYEATATIITLTNDTMEFSFANTSNGVSFLKLTKN